MEKIPQRERLYYLLSDGEAHRTDEIASKIYSGGSLARVGARIWDIKKKYGVKIEGWHDQTNPKLYWYRIKPIEYSEPKLEDMPEYSLYNSNKQVKLL